VDALAHLALEFRRAEAEALAGDLVEKRALGAHAELSHPRDELLVGIATRGAQHVRGVAAPLHRDDHDAEEIRPEVLRKGASGLEPAADEIAARMLRAALVDRAAVVAAEMARRAGFHFVPFDHARDPAVAARGAAAALPAVAGSDGNGGPVALL